MPAITLNTVATVPAAGDSYTYTTAASGAVFWRGGDVDVELSITEGTNTKQVAVDSGAEGFYDCATGEDLVFQVTPNKLGGDFWFKVSV